MKGGWQKWAKRDVYLSLKITTRRGFRTRPVQSILTFKKNNKKPHNVHWNNLIRLFWGCFATPGTGCLEYVQGTEKSQYVICSSNFQKMELSWRHFDPVHWIAQTNLKLPHRQAILNYVGQRYWFSRPWADSVDIATRRAWNLTSIWKRSFELVICTPTWRPYNKKNYTFESTLVALASTLGWFNLWSNWLNRTVLELRFRFFFFHSCTRHERQNT